MNKILWTDTRINAEVHDKALGMEARRALMEMRDEYEAKIAALGFSVPSGEPAPSQALPNATLLAAASDLLAACKQARDALQELIGADYDRADDIAMLDAAIAKATNGKVSNHDR